jgi:mannan endo-1,4-beta-mannosidase
MRGKTLRAAIGVAVAASLAGCGFMHPPTAQVALAGAPVVATLPIKSDHYLGAYESTAPDSYAAISSFGSKVGRQPNLAPYYSAWLEPFQAKFAATAHAHGATPLMQLNPDHVSVQAIANGQYNPYLQSLAAEVRDFRYPVIIGFGHEANGPWFKWGWTHVKPKVWVAAWRRVVRVFRSAGALNVTWLWTMNRNGNNTAPLRDYWPGANYVTWIGIDGYYEVPQDDFANIFRPTMRAIRKFSHKPVLISETAAGPGAGQAAKVPNLMAGMRKSKVLGFVWFDEYQDIGIHHQDWRIGHNKRTVKALRVGLRNYG